MEPIIFAGTPENAAQSLRDLVKAGYEVRLVITREDAPIGRKRVVAPSPVALAAVDLGLKVLKTNRITPEDESFIGSVGARLAVVVAFGALLKQSTIETLELGWFNLHYSVLPRWRGASPVQSSLAAGDASTGVTLFKIDQGLDTGFVVGVAETMIEPGENAARLLARLTALGSSLLSQELPRLLAGVAALTPQLGVASYAPKIDRTMSKISLADSAATAINKVLAYNPEPMAWLEFNGQPLRVLDARQVTELLASGELKATIGGVLLGLGDGSSIELLEVQPAGKPVMKATDWFRGTKETERSIS